MKALWGNKKSFLTSFRMKRNFQWPNFKLSPQCLLGEFSLKKIFLRLTMELIKHCIVDNCKLQKRRRDGTLDSGETRDANFKVYEWMRSQLTTDVRRTLHAKPLGVSKTSSAHPVQQGGERERTVGKRA
jgi:hypothetical protein